MNKKCTTKTRTFKGRDNNPHKHHYQHPLLQYSSHFGLFNQNQFQSYSYYPALLPLPPPIPLQLALTPPLSQNQNFQTETHLQKLPCKVNDSPPLATSSLPDTQVPALTMTPGDTPNISIRSSYFICMYYYFKVMVYFSSTKLIKNRIFVTSFCSNL